MSRIEKQPINVPQGVEVTLGSEAVDVKGPLGRLQLTYLPAVEVDWQEEGVLICKRKPEDVRGAAMAGSMRMLLSNMVLGVSEGFTRRLQLVGVGMRAQMDGKRLNLSLGFSHPVRYALPEGIQIETPSPTEILIKGVDKRMVGQVAAEIRSFRPPEPYKGKGVRYFGERIVIKETKKK